MLAGDVSGGYIGGGSGNGGVKSGNGDVKVGVAVRARGWAVDEMRAR
jgi:hypothetical protein